MSDQETATILSKTIYQPLTENQVFGNSDRYKVLKTTADNLSSGYYGAIILDTQTNTTWLANRGTQIAPVDYNDLGADYFIQIVQIKGATGLTDEAALETLGSLIV